MKNLLNHCADSGFSYIFRSKRTPSRSTLRVGALLLACGVSWLSPALADEPLVGEMRLFAFNWCPKDWASAQGQTLPIAQNTGLFGLLGATYGGNGYNTFSLPDLSGRIPIGSSASLPVGAKGGDTIAVLNYSHLPAHNHSVQATTAPATHAAPTGALNQTLAQAREAALYRAGPSDGAGPSTAWVGGAPVPVQNPYLTMTWCVALRGQYPQRD